MNARDSERHARLQLLLENRRREVQEKVRSLRDDAARERDVKDQAEQNAYDFAQALDLAVLEMKHETLALIDDALRRLRRGEYGRCAECGEPIAEARLAALPFARLCVACQEEEERGGPERDGSAFARDLSETLDDGDDGPGRGPGPSRRRNTRNL